jgi:hypothetical protein
MTMSSDTKAEPRSFTSPVISPGTQHLIGGTQWSGSEDQKFTSDYTGRNTEGHIQVDSEISMDIGNLSQSTPLSSRMNNSISTSDVNENLESKFSSSPKSKTSKQGSVHKEIAKVAPKLELGKFPSIYQVHFFNKFSNSTSSCTNQISLISMAEARASLKKSICSSYLKI